MEFQDIRNGLVAAIAINVIEPTFESQTKIKLGSLTMAPEKIQMVILIHFQESVSISLSVTL